MKAERVSSLGKGPSPSSFKEALLPLFFKHSIIMMKDVIKCTHGHMIACRNDIIDPHLCSLQYTGASTYSSFPFFFLPPLTSTKPNGLFLQKPGSWNIKIDWLNQRRRASPGNLSLELKNTWTEEALTHRFEGGVCHFSVMESTTAGCWAVAFVLSGVVTLG